MSEEEKDLNLRTVVPKQAWIVIGYDKAVGEFVVQKEDEFGACSRKGYVEIRISDEHIREFIEELTDLANRVEAGGV